MPANKPYCRGDFPFRSIDDIEYANERSGGHYFEASTMRFFNSRVLDGVYDGRYFVTSERCDWGGDYTRTYSLREALPSGRVETVGDFQEYATARAARKAAEAIRPNFSVYLAGIVVWAHEHGKTWQEAADYCGLYYKRGDASRNQRARINADRRELRRMFRLHERETVSLP